MFVMHMPEDFKIGDSADCRINGEPARLTCFFCGDRGVPSSQHGIDIIPDGGFIVYEKP